MVEKGELRNAQIALGTAHQLAMYMGIKYYGKKGAYSCFVDVKDQQLPLTNYKNQSLVTKKVAEQQEETERVMEQLERERIKTSKKSKLLQNQINKTSATEPKVADSLQWNEAKTRALLFDAIFVTSGMGCSQYRVCRSGGRSRLSRKSKWQRLCGLCALGR